jgi:SHS family lactate transporter-like MFS transporter
MVATPLFWANIIVFAGNSLWGFVSDIWGRRPGMILPATIAIFVTPFYLWTTDPIYIVSAFIVQGTGFIYHRGRFGAASVMRSSRPQLL